MQDGELGEVIVEFVRNGTYVKCNAVHTATGIEVSAMGPALPVAVWTALHFT